MNRSSQLRNAGFAILIIFSITLMSLQLPTSSVNAQQAIGVSPSSISVSVAPGSSNTATLTITNSNITGAADRNFTLGFSNTPSGFTTTSSGTTFIAVGNSQAIQITIASTSTSQAPGEYTGGSVTVTGRATSENDISTSVPLTIIVTGATFTPTPSLTATTGPATITPTPGPVCSDGFEPDNNPASSRNLDVNTAQQHAICPANDEDWLVFGGVAGKVYTVDVSRQDPGIDLTLEIFDKDLNSIAFNDDFYNRDPANPNPGDTKPRITIRIPFDGPYFVKVRDAAGRGGVNYIYDIALLDESYGPTPSLVREICEDRFEPDGLPEQARLITSNEIQEEHRLCPTGDADWVMFFGKTGKRYIIFTDTRRYVGSNTVNGEAQAGADTVIVLTDRDGVSLLDVNDDIPGASSLDSQIEFTPEVDGFYFVQIKNVGDIGNQFIRYDLTLLLCLPGQTDCGRGAVNTTAPVQPITPQPTGTPANEFVLDPTNTPRPTATPTP
ncbi:peptidase [Chloroflexales bacterium ZM16-3]|nr:peptidase [Chloroflexales bacterium ZM16-3]